MRTGSNHEYREAKKFVRQAWCEDLNGLDRCHSKTRIRFIKLAAHKYGVTVDTVRRWLKGSPGYDEITF